MPISVLRSKKTSGNLGNLYVNDWKREIGKSTLYLVSVTFKDKTETLLDLKSKVNTISQAFSF